jgi:serine/threonine protein phosphatase PrpC
VDTETYGSQHLGVTRALGDYFMQWHGATWEPGVSCIDLLDVASQLGRVTLLLGSDGLWDLWKYKEALQYPLGAPPPSSVGALMKPLASLMEETRQQGEELFGETADNITAIVVSCDISDAGDLGT